VDRYGAAVVLTGRNPLDARRSAVIEAMRARGARISFTVADVTNLEQVKRAVRFTKNAYRALHGVIHCAGVVKDGLLARCREKDVVEEILRVKARGALVLDYATRDEALESFVLFSSLSSLVGNPGQSLYACANGFLDGFSEARQDWVERGERSGKTV